METGMRLAESRDVDALVELRALMFHDIGLTVNATNWEPAAREWFARAVDDPAVCLVVVENNSRVLSCGMAQLSTGAPAPTCPSGRTVHLSNLVTHRDVRGRGFASQCMTHLLDWAQTQQADRVELHASSDGMVIYRQMGFQEISNPTMRLRLQSAKSR